MRKFDAPGAFQRPPFALRRFSVAPAHEVGGLRGVACARDGVVVCRTRLAAAAETSQQRGSGRVVGVVAGERRLEPVDDRQCHLRAVELDHGDGPVEGDDRRGVETDELVVGGDDLRPVGIAGVVGGG